MRRKVSHSDREGEGGFPLLSILMTIVSYEFNSSVKTAASNLTLEN